MDEAGKERIEMDGRQVSLLEALALVDEALRAGRVMDHVTLRELCARWYGDEQLAKRLREAGTHWPKWAKGCAMEGVHISIARQHGCNQSFVALSMELNQTPPSDPDLLPIQAWTVLNRWLSEGGRKSGVDLPDWVWDYLGEASRKMQDLRAKAYLHPSDRLKKIPAALGYSDGRRNIFAADLNDMETGVAALIYDGEGCKGVKGEARIAAVRDFSSLQDTRTARRYVAKGKRGMKPPPPWLKQPS